MEFNCPLVFLVKTNLQLNNLCHSRKLDGVQLSFCFPGEDKPPAQQSLPLQEAGSSSTVLLSDWCRQTSSSTISATPGSWMEFNCPLVFLGKTNIQLNNLCHSRKLRVQLSSCLPGEDKPPAQQSPPLQEAAWSSTVLLSSW